MDEVEDNNEAVDNMYDAKDNGKTEEWMKLRIIMRLWTICMMLMITVRLRNG